MGVFLSKLIGKSTRAERERKKAAFIRELLRIKSLRNQKAKPDEYIKNLAHDFLIDEMTVTKKDGSVLLTTDKTNAFKKAVASSSVYEFIKSEYPDSKMLTIKDDNHYNIIYSEGNLIYIMKSTGEVTPIETKKIVEYVNGKLNKAAIA